MNPTNTASRGASTRRYLPVPVELDKAGLSPFAFRLYCHFIRKDAFSLPAESAQADADACGMSRAQFFRAIKDLIARSMIDRVAEEGGLSSYVPLHPDAWRPLPGGTK